VAEITRKRQGELVRGVFGILANHPEGLRAADVLARVEENVPPTPFEDSTYPKHPNVRRFEKIVRFSTIAAVKAGWLVKDKGHWSLTDAGLSAFSRFTDPEEFQREAARLYKVWEAERPEPDVMEETDETAESLSGFEEAEEAAWDQIRTYLANMPPYDFQQLVGALLRAMGYYVAWVAPPGPDRGMDLIAYNDPLGTSTPRIVVQVKRQPETKVSSDALRSFMAVLGDRDVGIFISAGGFTSDAEKEARTQERRRLTLLDLDRLVELWIKHSASLEDEDRARLPLKPVYFLASG
jgi:restriction system protein